MILYVFKCINLLSCINLCYDYKGVWKCRFKWILMFVCCYFRFGNFFYVFFLWYDLWGGEEYNYLGFYRCGFCIFLDFCFFFYFRVEGWEKDYVKWVILKVIRLLKIKIFYCLVDFFSFNIFFYLFFDFRKKIFLLFICNRIF